MERIYEIRKRFDELCPDKPSRVLLDIYDYEEKHAARVLKEYGRFISQFELFYDLLVKIIHGVNYIDKVKWPKHRGVQFMLVAYNLKSIFSSFRRLIRGFYEDSLILLRSPYEAFIKVVYITCYPEDPYSVVSGRKSASGRKFNLTNFLKDELRLDWYEYHLFSSMSHAGWFTVLKEAAGISRVGQKDPITLKFEFDKKLLELGINEVGFLLSAYLNLVISLFATECNDYLKKEWIEKGKELVALREEGFSLHPKDYWPQLVQDIKDIFEMIQEVECGNKDWGSAWRNIRNHSQRAVDGIS